MKALGINGREEKLPEGGIVMAGTKRALIIGAGAQDASYLAEFLLENGYEVWGLTRRSSGDNLFRLKPPYSNILSNKNYHIVYGDVTDYSSIERALFDINPQELYNIAAMSFVGASFDIPIQTLETTGLGPVNVLEAIRQYQKNTGKEVKSYFCGSSEMFGSNFTVKDHPKFLNKDGQGKYQDENTTLCGNSPYGIAKVTGHRFVQLYRECYGIKCCSGMLLNHESVPAGSSLLIRDSDGYIDVLPIEDIFRTGGHMYEGIINEYAGQEVWNGDSWTKIIKGTCYSDRNKNVKLVQTRQSSYEATDDHVVFMENNAEKFTKDLTVGEHVFQCQYPKLVNEKISFTKNIAEFIGFVVGDGYVDERGSIRITSNDLDCLNYIKSLLEESFIFRTYLQKGKSGFENSKQVYHMNFDGENLAFFGKMLRNAIYTKRSKKKKVPKLILNSYKEIKEAFFKGYYLADGRKKGNEKWEYKGYTTNSQTLAMGLNLLVSECFHQVIKTKACFKNKNKYYYSYFNSPLGDKNRGKDKNEIIKIENVKDYNDGIFFDIQTESQTFCTGPNMFKIHNSPRRGEEFVTRKITKWFGEFYNKYYLTDTVDLVKNNNDLKLHLGWIDSARDWSHSKDMVKSMWMMIQNDCKTDYVVGSGTARTVKDFLAAVFSPFGLDYNDFIFISPECMRPREVEYLQADPTKIREELGWRPEISFDEMVKEMVSFDIMLAKNV